MGQTQPLSCPEIPDDGHEIRRADLLGYGSDREPGERFRRNAVPARERLLR